MKTEKKYSLPQSERLRGKTRIDNLFANAKGVLSYPYRALFTPNGEEKSVIMVSIPKRKFKHATDRNLLRRRTREAYRLNKALLAEQTANKGFDIAFLYIGDKKEEFPYLQKKMCDLLNKIATKVKEETEQE
ncbi:MAG: ribonuclease P protein component [Bacteroidales bacterium]|nr:ribonuclease P protein component [Bacteroidales bacterium]